MICPPAVLEGHLRALTQAGMQPVKFWEQQAARL